MRLRTLSSALIVFAVATAAAPCRGQSCDEPRADTWVTNMRDHLYSFDRLARFAISRYGRPAKCDGAVTATFDGQKFGKLQLGFASGASFAIETQPPEASTAALIDSTGIAGPAAALDSLKAYAADIGLSIDWGKPTTTSDGKLRIETYWDPDDGMNASARLVFADSLLVEMRVSLAL